jgi:hypothetical protein
VRAVVEAAGIRDILSKSLGSNNPVNVTRATHAALRNLSSAETLSERRGRKLRSVISGQPTDGSVPPPPIRHAPPLPERPMGGRGPRGQRDGQREGAPNAR